MKQRPAVMVIFASLLFVTLQTPEIQMADGFSKTFQLVPQAYQGIYSFELQVGDRIEGHFSLSNLGPYRDVFSKSQSNYYWINVWFEDPNGKAIMNFSHTSGASFNYTAVDWGTYDIWAFCSNNAFFENAKNAEITLNFDIIKAKMPESPNPEIVAWWKLNEGNGTTVYDSSWHNRQGTIYGAK